ncbi:MAG TPA: hypothetical protein DEQ32_13230 [Gammaproteobacteria bacterium]|nr:hypothetical protein [Gammaproteobacteria bacterium]
MEESKASDIEIGSLVTLKAEAMGYPMLDDPGDSLGVGLVIALERRSKKIVDIEMVHVLWTKTGKKRWEFLNDLMVVEHTY